MHGQDRSEERQIVRRGLRISWKFVRAHPVPFWTSVAGSVVMAIGTVLSTVLLGWLTDDLILPEFNGTEPGRSEFTVVAVVVAVAAARSMGVVVRRYFAGMTRARSKNDLQLELGDKYLALPAHELRVAKKGRLLAHADSDVDVAVDMLNPLPFTVGVFTLLAVSVLSLALVDWVLMVVALSLMPLIAGLNQLNAAVARGPAIDEREATGRVSAVASESFDGALVVKTLGREAAELERFSSEADNLRHHAVRLGRVRALFAAALDLVPDIGVVLLVSLGAWRVANAHITVGQLVQAVALFSLLVFPLRVIGYFFGDIPPSVIAYDRVARVLARPTAADRGRAPLGAGPFALRVQGATVRYRDQTALVDASLDLEPGEVVALVGPTGSGKSTLITAIVDMVPLDSGVVTISGHEIGQISGGALASRVAVVWQQPFLLDASITDNITFGGRYDEVDVRAAARAASFADVVESMPEGYDTRVGESGVRLSGGQRQRLALARALIRRPGLLLLDDAMSAVDPVTEEEILNEIKALGSTILIVAHRRSTILLADRVAMMSAGAVSAVGTHDELLDKAAYVALLEAYEREVAAP